MLLLRRAKELVDAPDKRLRYKICKNEHKYCAVIKAYDNVKHLLLVIVEVNLMEHSIITILFQKIDSSIEDGKSTKQFKLFVLPMIHDNTSKLAELLKDSKKDVDKNGLTLQALYDCVVAKKRPTIKLSRYKQTLVNNEQNN